MEARLNIESDKELAVEGKLIEYFDRRTLEMIAQRFDCNERIALFKYHNEICNPAREAELVSVMEREFRHLPRGFVREYYSLILRYSKEIMQGVVDDIESYS